MYREKKAINIALYGLLIALAMVLSFVETLIPIPIPVPGVKLGTREPCDGGGTLPDRDPRNDRGDPDPHRSCGFIFWKSIQYDLRAVRKLSQPVCDGNLKENGKLSQIGISVLGGIRPQHRPDHIRAVIDPDSRRILLSPVPPRRRLHRRNPDRSCRRDHYRTPDARNARYKKIKYRLY